MTLHSTGILDVVPAAEPAPLDSAPPVDRPALVRPADLVAVLTGASLCFFSLFVFAITQWQYVGPAVEGASVLGWLAPLVAGGVCILVSVAAVAARLVARRRSERVGS